ncbi:MAG: Gar1/Naf1 family protein [Candidatus Bathyarchaeia archaeon]
MTPIKSSSKRYLGEGDHVSHSSKNLILRTKMNPGIGAPVYNEKGRRVGKIYDVFGPVDEPFVSLEVDDDPYHLISEKLYISKGRT